MPKNKKSKRLNVEYISIDSIKAYDNNVKIHSAKQVAQIKRSIEEFGYTAPVLVDENLECIAGHGRLSAARLLNMYEIPVIRLEHLTPEQKRAYRICDNKLSENGQWNLEALQFEFKELELSTPQFSLDITGFDLADIDGMLQGPSFKANPADNNIPLIDEAGIVSQPGDVWVLGKHRVICGDSLKKETFEKLMAGKKADMIFEDAPYNLAINGQVCGKGATKHKEFAMASGEMTPEEFQAFLKTNFELLVEFSKKGSLHYLCMDWRNCKSILLAGEVYTEFKNLCVWNKNNAGLGSMYRSKHELVFIFKNGKAPHINNVELGIHGRYRVNVWDYPGVNSFGKERKNLKIHPTTKPVEMVKDAILDASHRGGIILDSFLGSGSTLIAAEKAGRICYGIEIDPLYVDTTIRRFQDLSGKDAVHAASNKTYNELLNLKKDGK